MTKRNQTQVKLTAAEIADILSALRGEGVNPIAENDRLIKRLLRAFDRC